MFKLIDDILNPMMLNFKNGLVDLLYSEQSVIINGNNAGVPISLQLLHNRT